MVLLVLQLIFATNPAQGCTAYPPVVVDLVHQPATEAVAALAATTFAASACVPIITALDGTNQVVIRADDTLRPRLLETVAWFDRPDPLSPEPEALPDEARRSPGETPDAEAARFADVAPDQWTPEQRAAFLRYVHALQSLNQPPFWRMADDQFWCRVRHVIFGGRPIMYMAGVCESLI